MEHKRPTVKKPMYKRDPMPQYKWSKVKNYPNGSKNIFHNNVRGRIIVHLFPRQTLEQYWNIHGKFPVPGRKPIKLWVPPPNRNTRTPRDNFGHVRRVFNELHKPWAVHKDDYNKLTNKPRDNMGVTMTIRSKDKDLFFNALKKLNFYDIGVNPNGNGKWFANLTYGFNVKLKMTDSENFMKNIKINRTTPVLG